MRGLLLLANGDWLLLFGEAGGTAAHGCLHAIADQVFRHSVVVDRLLGLFLFFGRLVEGLAGVVAAVVDLRLLDCATVTCTHSLVCMVGDFLVSPLLLVLNCWVNHLLLASIALYG